MYVIFEAKFRPEGSLRSSDFKKPLSKVGLNVLLYFILLILMYLTYNLHTYIPRNSATLNIYDCIHTSM